MTLRIVDMAYASGGEVGLEGLVRRLYAGSRIEAWPEHAVALPDLVNVLGERVTVDGHDLPRIGAIVLGPVETAGAAKGLAMVLGRSGTTASGHRLDVPVVAMGSRALGQALGLAERWLTEDALDLVLLGSEGPGYTAVVVLAPDGATGTGSRRTEGAAYAVISGLMVGSGPDGGDDFGPALAQLGLDVRDIGLLAPGEWPPAEAVVADYRGACRYAFEDTGASAVVASATTPVDELVSPDLTCAVGIGESDGPGSPLVSLIKAALCVDGRMWVPSLTTDRLDDAGPDLEVAWRGTPFFSVTTARPWMVPVTRRRVADVVYETDEGTAHILVSEARPRRAAPAARPDLIATRPHLVPIIGETVTEILAVINDLRTDLTSGADLGRIAAEHCYRLSDHGSGAYILALVARDRDELLKEMDHAQDGLAKAAASGKAWQTPRGSTFAPDPLGAAGVTFVYPGVFNSYPGLASDLFQHFPGLQDALGEITAHPGAVLAERWLYPRRRQGVTDEDLQSQLLLLQDCPEAMIESGATVAIAHTRVMADIFGVRPRAALGYSMGEVSMLWATGVWHDADAGSQTLHASPLFQEVISGPKLAVKAHWGLEEDESVDWATYLLKAKVDRVREAVAAEARVYVTFVNLDNEVVIAGEAAACERVVAALKCHALPVPASVAIHNEAIGAAYRDFVTLYTHPVAAAPDLTFYSAADYAPLRLEKGALADAMATMCCRPVDFPRLVSRAYDDGARLFLELGPLGTCTRRIKRILRDQPHAAVAVNPTPGEDLDGIVRALAVLVAHHVPVDLAPLYAVAQPSPVRFIADADGRAPEAPDRGSVTSHAAAEDSQQIGEPASVGAVPSLFGSSPALLNLYGHQLLPQQNRAAALHAAFLTDRGAAQSRAGAVIELQLAAGRQLLGMAEGGSAGALGAPRTSTGADGLSKPSPPATSQQRQGLPIAARTGRNNPARFGAHSDTRQRRPARPALFDEAALHAFASGDVTRCFGADFDIYRGRRLPRIPNGDLLMMSRVTAIQGATSLLSADVGHNNQGGPIATLRSEFDIDDGAWFYQGGPADRRGGYPGLPPYVVLMEMALQPCGFLSAYLRSSLLEPDRNLYFRNLDGRGRVLADLDLRGKTVQDDVRLLTSTRGQGVIIQTYDFSLSCEGVPFYEGWSSFGYFPLPALQRQVGLDLGSSSEGQDVCAKTADVLVVDSGRIQGPRQIAVAADVTVLQADDATAHPTLLLRGQVNTSDWYFRNHFYEDPVMPGSLGVEAAMQAMLRYARWRYPTLRGEARQLMGHEMVWKYRGQITPEDAQWREAIRLTDVRSDTAGVTLVGDVILWKGEIPIYRVEGAAVRIDA